MTDLKPSDTLAGCATVDQVAGVVWPWGEHWEDSPQVVSCFSPKVPGVALTAVATQLGFTRLSEPDMAAPTAATLSWNQARLEIHAFGRVLWTSLALQSPSPEVLSQLQRAVVLVLDEPGGLGFRTFPRLPPEDIFAGRFTFS